MTIRTEDTARNEGSDTGEMFRAVSQSSLQTLRISVVWCVDQKVVLCGLRSCHLSHVLE